MVEINLLPEWYRVSQKWRIVFLLFCTEIMIACVIVWISSCYFHSQEKILHHRLIKLVTDHRINQIDLIDQRKCRLYRQLHNQLIKNDRLRKQLTIQLKEVGGEK